MKADWTLCGICNQKKWSEHEEVSYSDKPDFVTAAGAPAAGVGSNLEVADVGEDKDVWVSEEEEEVGEVVEEGQQEEREHAHQDSAV